MSRIHVECPDCKGVFDVKAMRAGHRVACKLCGSVVRVPDGETGPSEPRPVLKRMSYSDASLSEGSRIDSPRRRKGRQFASDQLRPWLLAGGGGLAVLIVIGAFLAGRGSAPVTPTAIPPTAVDASSSQPLPIAANATASIPPVATPAVSVESIPVAPTVNLQATAAPAEASAVIASMATSSSESPVPTSAPEVPAEPLVKMELPELITKVEPAVVRINVVKTRGQGHGSGFVVDRQGTVLTNHHVMEDATRAQVEFADGTTTDVKGFRYLSPLKDIAVIDIDLPEDKLQIVPVAEQLPPKGASVVAFGAPLGLSFSTTDGIVSAVRKADDVTENIGEKVEGEWIQTTTPISPGNSGGPLVDLYGRVIGMNTMGFTEGQNLNFAISGTDIRQAIAAAPSQVQPLKPGAIAARAEDKAITRRAAVDEVGTDRGRKLLAETKEIFLLNAMRRSSFDPTGAVWERVIRRSEMSVEKSGIQLSFGEPAPDAAVLIVLLDLKPTRKGTSGTQELSIKGELICVDPFAKSANKIARVWQGEQIVGTISLDAILAGRVPRAADDNIAKFFTSFRTAYQRAVREQKEPETPGGDAAKPAGSENP